MLSRCRWCGSETENQTEECDHCEIIRTAVISRPLVVAKILEAVIPDKYKRSRISNINP